MARVKRVARKVRRNAPDLQSTINKRRTKRGRSLSISESSNASVHRQIGGQAAEDHTSRPETSQPFKYRDYVIVCVDIATTYSGILYCLPHEKEPHLLASWPGQPDAVSAVNSVPSQITYWKDGSQAWGYEANPTAEDGVTVRYFKILFNSDGEPSELRKEAVSLCEKIGRSEETVAVDFGTHLLRHMCEREPDVQNWPVRIVAALPKGDDTLGYERVEEYWEAAARNVSLKVESVVIHPEGVAAMLPSYSKIRHRGSGLYACVDFGGGTCDFMAANLDVEDENDDDGVVIRRYCHVPPALWAGGENFGKRWDKFWKEKLGETKFERSRRSLDQMWETVKTQRDWKQRVQLPQELVELHIEFTEDLVREIEGIFDGPLGEIESYLDEGISDTKKAVGLSNDYRLPMVATGGLIDQRRLKDRLKAKYNDRIIWSETPRIDVPMGLLKVEMRLERGKEPYPRAQNAYAVVGWVKCKKGINGAKPNADLDTYQRQGLKVFLPLGADVSLGSRYAWPMIETPGSDGSLAYPVRVRIKKLTRGEFRRYKEGRTKLGSYLLSLTMPGKVNSDHIVTPQYPKDATSEALHYRAVHWRVVMTIEKEGIRIEAIVPKNEKMKGPATIAGKLFLWSELGFNDQSEV